MTNLLTAARDEFITRHPEMRVDLGGRDWGYWDVGQGDDALLLIPGTLGRGDVFWNQIDALKDRMRIVAVSYPDSGGVADWAQDMVQLLDTLGITKVSVLGSSLGGYLAQLIAGTYPDRVTRLLAANTLHSVAGLDRMPPYTLDLQSAPIEELRAGFGNGLNAWAKAHPDQGDLVELLLAEAGGRILQGELRARLEALKSGPELPAISLSASDSASDLASDPASVIVTIESDDDPLIPAPIRDAVRGRLNPGVAYRFKTGGHFPYIARPAAYTALLEQVLGLDNTGPEWGLKKERSL